MSNHWLVNSSFTLNKNHAYVVSIPASPNDDYFPIDTSKNWSYKLSGNWNGPKDIVVGMIMEAFSGFKGTRTYVFRAAGENGGLPLRQLASVTLRLEPTNSESEKSYAQMNLRLGKKFRIGTRTIQSGRVERVNTNAVKGRDPIRSARNSAMTNG
jgi:hypothetical protein